MEVNRPPTNEQQTDEVLDELLKDQTVEAYFSKEELRALTSEMMQVAAKVLGKGAQLKEVTFHNDTDNFFNINENMVHFGLAVIKQKIKTWFELLTGGGSAYMPKEIIKEYVRASMRRLAAHEAGHRVIDRHPVTEMGLTQKEWGQLGISSFANSAMDCRDDGRIMSCHEDLKDDEKNGLEEKFGPSGPLDWPSSIPKQMLRRGYRLKFTELDCEMIREWAHGKHHEAIDPCVLALLEKIKDVIPYFAEDKKCVPGLEPSDIEVKTKGRNAYRKVAELYKGDYQKLIEADRDNQTVHQAISVVGLFKNNFDLPEKLKKFLEGKLLGLDPALAQELETALQNQREAKVRYEAENHPIEKGAEQVGKAAQDIVGAGGEKPKEPPKKPEVDILEILGPAVHVEELSEGLRDWLKKLFEEMSEIMAEEILKQLLGPLLQQFLENPEKFLKQAEDELNKKLRPAMVPATHPTHEEIEKGEAWPKEVPPQTVFQPAASLLPPESAARLMPRELEETERWLEQNVDMQERIQAWREAIFAARRGGHLRTSRATSRLHGPSVVREDIDRAMGAEQAAKIFLKPSMKRGKITLSVLWRTGAMPVSEALKLFLFLLKIYEDNEIRRYLDLEILISQDIPGLAEDAEAAVPVVLKFGDDPISDREKIMGNLLALQRTAGGGGSVRITEDATALREQRQRLLRQNPQSRMRFAIDLWDEAAIQSDSPDPYQAVKQEIETTQEALRGHAFCFVLQPFGARTDVGEWYGKDHFLAWNSVEKLISHLDIVCRTMIRYKDEFASRIEEAIENPDV